MIYKLCASYLTWSLWVTVGRHGPNYMHLPFIRTMRNSWKSPLSSFHCLPRANSGAGFSMVQISCKYYQWMEDIYRVTIIENEASVRLFSNGCRWSFAFVSLSSLKAGLQWCSPILVSSVSSTAVASSRLCSALCEHDFIQRWRSIVQELAGAVRADIVSMNRRGFL